jgi:hypothetical protein
MEGKEQGQTMSTKTDSGVNQWDGIDAMHRF